jgi:hypothetical protein
MATMAETMASMLQEIISRNGHEYLNIQINFI